MELSQLKALIAVAEERSISKAARRLHLAQPSLSQAMRRLERELGVELLVRSPQGVELTSAGQRLYVDARDILARVDEAVHAISSDIREHLRVGLVAGRFAAADLTGPLLTSFSSAHPNVHLELVELNMAEQAMPLVDRGVDVALVRAPLATPGIELYPLFSEPRALVFSANNPLSSRASISFEELLELPMMSLDRSPPEWSAFWRLDDLRYASAPEPMRIDAVTVDEFELAIGVSVDRVMTAAACVPRLSTYRVLKYLTLPPEVPHSIIAVARREGDMRWVVKSFIEHAQMFCSYSTELSPGAVSMCAVK